MLRASLSEMSGNCNDKGNNTDNDNDICVATYFKDRLLIMRMPIRQYNVYAYSPIHGFK